MLRRHAKQRCTRGSTEGEPTAPAVTEEFCCLLVAQVPDYLICLLDPQGNITSWNKGAERFTGYRAAEVLGKPSTLLYTPDEIVQGIAEQALKAAVIQGRFETEGWRVRRDGTRYWINLTIAALRDDIGRLVGFVQIAHDLTKRRQGEEAIRASEKRFRLLVENTQDVIFETRLKPTRVQEYVSGAASTVFGYSPADFYADPDLPLQIVSTADSPLLEEIWDDPVKFSGQTINLQFWRKDGSLIWVEQRTTPVCDESGHVVGIQGVARDITDRKRAEDELRASQERLTRILETDADGIIVMDRNERIAMVNAAMEKMGGRPRSEMIGLYFADPIWKFETLEGKPLPAGKLATAQVLRSGKPVYGVQLSIQRADGQRVVLSVNAGPVRDESGGIAGVVLSLRDITEQTRLEKERLRLINQLADEQSWLQTVIDRAAVGIILYRGTQGERAVANARADELFGRSITPEEGARQYVGQVYHPDGKPYTYKEMASIRALQGQIIFGEEAIIRQPSGQELSVLASAAPIRDPQGKIIGAVVVLEDITPIRKLEREREEWTSVIAHDLRQPVTVIAGYANLLLRQADRYPTPVKARVTNVLASATQLNRMISDLLDVSRIEARRLALERRPVDLSVLVREVVERAAPLTKGHPVRVTVAGVIPQLQLDPGRIEQSLSNLLSNAAKYSYPDTEIVVSLQGRDAEVEVGVTNQGPGIAPEELPKLFHRFYRTAETRTSGVAGVGLGLYITKGLVEAHGGRIWAESIPARTTTFRFTLPLRPPPD